MRCARTMNPYDLDALAERSGLRLPPLKGSRLRFTRTAQIVAACLAAPVLLAFIVWCSVGIANTGASTEPGWVAGQRVAPDPAKHLTGEARHLCAQRWPGTRVLFVEDGDLSANIACGNPKNRVVTGHVEVAYPSP
jgi:hypothetical protein